MPLGKILYRAKMRKPLNEAIQWFNQKNNLGDKLAKDSKMAVYNPNKTTNGAKKIFEITVGKCQNFRRGDKQFASGTFDPKFMQPFYSFDFYTFEYRSGIASGNNPTFNQMKAYEIEENKELLDYLKNQFLKIDFIDESVDLAATPEANDYIGSVRIPLKEML